MRPQYVGLKTCRNRPSGLPDNVSGAAGKIIDVFIGHIQRQLDLLSGILDTGIQVYYVCPHQMYLLTNSYYLRHKSKIILTKSGKSIW